MGGISKKVKKVFKKVDPFTSKVVDPILGNMGLPNVSGRNAAQEAAQEQARQSALQAERHAAMQQANTIEQARGSALAMQTEVDRSRIQAELQQAQQQAPVQSPTVEVAPVTAEASARRKKFQTPQVGGTAGGGASIRL